MPSSQNIRGCQKTVVCTRFHFSTIRVSVLKQIVVCLNGRQPTMHPCIAAQSTATGNDKLLHLGTLFIYLTNLNIMWLSVMMMGHGSWFDGHIVKPREVAAAGKLRLHVGSYIYNIYNAL